MTSSTPTTVMDGYRILQAEPECGDVAWRDLLATILASGDAVEPRGQCTLEVLHTNNIRIDMRRPVVMSPERKLNYRFMAAEALWILSGSNELAPLQRFIKTYDRFSDDGVTLFGAYGPPVTRQVPYVVSKLLADRDTRQAVLTIWQQNPPESKDIPCTVAMAFSIRQGKLHQHVYMRSSDAWLGIPYDMFSFAMIGINVACAYNFRRDRTFGHVLPGALTISMTSSHIYLRDLDSITRVLSSPEPSEPLPIPDAVVAEGNWNAIEDALTTQRETYPTNDWNTTIRSMSNR